MSSRPSFLVPPPLTPPGTKVDVRWAVADLNSWTWNHVLYLYQNPDRSIFYIGKAYDCTVLQRRQDHISEGLVRTAPLSEPGLLTVMVGVPVIQSGQFSLTDSLVSDVEALLIREIRPAANTQIRDVTRDNFEVTCGGTWPHFKTVFTNSPEFPLSSFLRGLI